MFKDLFKRKKTKEDASQANAGAKKEGMTTQVRFKTPVCRVPRQLSTQAGERTVSCWDEVREALEQMLESDDEFVVLSVGDPRYDIFFVQTTPNTNGSGYVVQLSIRDGDGSRLVEKVWPVEECFDIFRKFYDTTCVEGLEQYKPVEFFT